MGAETLIYVFHDSDRVRERPPEPPDQVLHENLLTAVRRPTILMLFDRKPIRLHSLTFIGVRAPGERGHSAPHDGRVPNRSRAAALLIWED